MQNYVELILSKFLPMVPKIFYDDQLFKI